MAKSVIRSNQSPAEILARVEEIDKYMSIGGQIRARDYVFLRNKLREALTDRERLDILEHAVVREGLYVDPDALPPISVYRPESVDGNCVFLLRDAADKLLARTAEGATHG